MKPKTIILITLLLFVTTGCSRYDVDDLCFDYEYGYSEFKTKVSNCAYGHGNESFNKDIVNLKVTYDIYDENYKIVETITTNYDDPIPKNYNGVKIINTKYDGLIQKVEAKKATFELK